MRETTETVKEIRQWLETTQSRQKSYADRRIRPLEFEVGEALFLKVAPVKDVMRFGKKGKLSPRYVGPFEIIALSPELSSVHDVFHVSMMKKYVSDLSHVLNQELIEVHEDSIYEEKPVTILDKEKKYVLRNKVIS